MDIRNEMQTVANKLGGLENDINTLKQALNNNQLLNGFYSGQDMQNKLIELNNLYNEGVNYYRQLEAQVASFNSNNNFNNNNNNSGAFANSNMGGFNSNSGGMFNNGGDNNNGLFAANQQNNMNSTHTEHKKTSLRKNKGGNMGTQDNNNNVNNNTPSFFSDDVVEPIIPASKPINQGYCFETLYPFIIADGMDVKNENTAAGVERVMYNSNDLGDIIPHVVNEDIVDMHNSNAYADKILLTKGVVEPILQTSIDRLANCVDFLDILKSKRSGSLISGINLGAYLDGSFTKYIRAGLYVNGIRSVPTSIFTDYVELVTALKKGRVKDYDIFKTLLDEINNYIVVEVITGEDEHKQLSRVTNYITSFVEFEDAINRSVEIQGASDIMKLTELSNLSVYNTINDILDKNELVGKVSIITTVGDIYTVIRGRDGIIVIKDGTI